MSTTTTVLPTTTATPTTTTVPTTTMPEHKVVYLYQCDFNKGPVVADRANTTYVFCEDIVFDPVIRSKKCRVNPYNPLDAVCPYSNGTVCDSENTNYKLGYPAAIIILADKVTIDMCGYRLCMSDRFYITQRFFAHIQIGPSPFLTGKGPAPTFDDQETYPTDVVITSTSCDRGVLGLTSHMSIMAVGNEQNKITVSNINFINNEVSAGIFNHCGEVSVHNCDLNNRDLIVPVNGSFSTLVQNSNKLQTILDTYSDWFATLDRSLCGYDSITETAEYLEDCIVKIECEIIRVTGKLRCGKNFGKKHGKKVCVELHLEELIDALLEFKRKLAVVKAGDTIDVHDVTCEGFTGSEPVYASDVRDTVRIYRELIKIKATYDDLYCAVMYNLGENCFTKLDDCTLHEFFNPSGHPDGSSFFGLSFVNSTTPGVADFVTVPEEEREGKVSVCNFRMRHVGLDCLEIPGIKYIGEVNNDDDPNNDTDQEPEGYSSTSTLKTMVGEILHLRDASQCSPFFEGRICVAELIREQRELTTNSSVTLVDITSALTGTMVIDDPELLTFLKATMKTIKSIRCRREPCHERDYHRSIKEAIELLTSSPLIGMPGSGSRYIITLDQDIMQHKPKGLIGIRIEGVKNYDVNCVELKYLSNVGLDYNRCLKGTSAFTGQLTTDADYIYEGCNVSGVVAASSGLTDDDSDIDRLVMNKVTVKQCGVKPKLIRIIENGVEVSVGSVKYDYKYNKDCYKPEKCDESKCDSDSSSYMCDKSDYNHVKYGKCKTVTYADDYCYSKCAPCKPEPKCGKSNVYRYAEFRKYRSMKKDIIG
jgi:hypothetical protein